MSLCAFSEQLTWIEPLLALSGRPRCIEIPRCLRDQHGIGSVIDLRSETSDDSDALSRAGISFLHLPTPDLEPVPEVFLLQGVGRARDALQKSERILIHCEHGIGRSALLMCCVLVSLGATPLEALKRVKGARPIVSPTPDQLHALLAWTEKWAQEAGSCRSVTWDQLAAVAYARVQSDRIW